jgi:ABC-type lipoprotein export system ATPase subunit
MLGLGKEMTDLFKNMTIGGQILKTKVELDDILINLSSANDYEFNGTSAFQVPTFIKPQEYNLGLIVGPSGTGKSTLLKEFGEELIFEPNPKKAIASQLDVNLLMRLGLSTIPSLCRPYHVLSGGEKHRANLAYTLSNQGTVFDEFTSTIHRNLARTISINLSKYVKQNDKQLVLATCHHDVAEWLEPDWIFNTVTKSLTTRRLERRPFNITINPCSTKAWKFFKDFHYLTSDINKSARCWVLHNDNKLAGFYSSIPFPSGTVKNAYRGHRLVIHPDFQGLGLSSLLVDYVADLHIKNGHRFYAKTAHPKLGKHRENSEKWRATVKNKRNRSKNYLTDAKKRKGEAPVRNMVDWETHAHRICFSHEYIG